MSVLLKFLTASKVADLPPVAQQYFQDDEDFIEVWGQLDDDEKCRILAGGLETCLQYKLKTDNEVLRMMALVIVGRYDDYDEEAEKEPEQVVEVPAPAPAPVPVPAPAPAPAPKKLRVKPDPDAPKRPRGRPPTDPNGEFYRCKMCEINCASSGSLFNHYHSKLHFNKVLTYLETAPNMLDPNKKYKVVVKTRNNAEGKKKVLTHLNPDEDTFIDLKDSVGGDNPIAFVELYEQYSYKSPHYEITGKEFICWKKVL